MLIRSLFWLAGTAAVSVTGDGLDTARMAELLRPYVELDPTGTQDMAHWSVSFEAPGPSAGRGRDRLLAAGNGHLRIRSDPRNDGDQIFALQLVRGLLVETVLRTHAQLHGSVVARHGRGIVFTGPKGAGKTSFLSSFLRQAPDFDFITNDKSVVSPSGREIIGLPYAVAVGQAGRRKTPELAAVAARSTGEKDLIWPADFADALASRLAARAEPALVVVCEADFSADQVVVTDDVGSADRNFHMGTSMANFGEAMLPGYLLGVPPPAGSRAFATAAVPREWRRLPWLRLCGNPWTMRRSNVDSVVAAIDRQKVES